MEDSQYIKTQFETLVRNLLMKKLLLPFLALILNACSSDPVEDFNKAVENANQKNWVKAAKYAKKASEANPTTLTEAFNAICLTKQDKTEDAIEILKRLATKEPKNATIQFLCGKSLFSTGQTNEAFEHLSKAYNLNRSNDDCLALLFQTAVILNKKNAFLLSRFAKSKPSLTDKATIENNIAVWWHTNQNSSRALDAFQAALEKDRHNTNIILNKAIISDKNGEYQGAQKLYEKYLRLTKDNPENHLAVTTRIDAIKRHLNN